MKKAIIILTGLLTNVFVSCSDVKTTELNMRIAELETQNKKLMDSITDIGNSKVISSKIYGLTDKPEFKVGEEIKVDFQFQAPVEISNYSVYSTSEDGKLDKLVYDNMTGNGFEYSITPKTKGEYPIKLWTVVNTHTSEYGEIHIPAFMTLMVTE